jgi:hypothetical protein
MLADVYGWFTEGFDTADLKDARALLDELSAATRVNLACASRRPLPPRCGGKVAGATHTQARHCTRRSFLEGALHLSELMPGGDKGGSFMDPLLGRIELLEALIGDAGRADRLDASMTPRRVRHSGDHCRPAGVRRRRLCDAALARVMKERRWIEQASVRRMEGQVCPPTSASEADGQREFATLHQRNRSA